MLIPYQGVDLLDMSPAGGCGCKLPLDQMNYLMKSINSLVSVTQSSSNVIVDGRSRDDAAVLRMPGGPHIVASVDFGTPVSSDPEVWARIGVSNALSDIYAMGGCPTFALSIIGWPSTMSSEMLSALATGAVTALATEQVPLIGGHTINAQTPIFGLAVIGQVTDGDLMLVGNAEPGQVLILTKPLGTGVIIAAQKALSVAPEVVSESEQLMTASNRLASRTALEAGISAATDVTGYGLIGHLNNMLVESGCSAIIAREQVPVIAAARRLLAEDGIVPNSAERTYLSLADSVEWTDTPLDLRFLMADPQTSGGLLLAAEPASADRFMNACGLNGQFARVIGRTVAGRPGMITVNAVTEGAL